MLKLLSCFAVIALVSCSIEDNKDLEPFHGRYKLIYTWPVPSSPIQNCPGVSYSKPGMAQGAITCSCNTRKNPNIGFLKQDTRYRGLTLMVDVVKSDSEAAEAMNDNCPCDPFTPDRVQFRLINEDYFLQYEKEEILRHYLFGRKVPTESELQNLLNGLGDLKNVPGKRVCNV